MSQPNSPSVCVAAYCPPPSFPGATAFYENIKRFRTAFPLVLFSDYDYGPDVLRLKTTPEIVKAAQYPNGVKNMFSISNLLFFTTLRILEGKEFTHLIYVEADCRVGCHEWDRKMWDERQQCIEHTRKDHVVAAGSVVGYSTSNAGLEFCREWTRFVRNNADARFPIPSYGGNGAAESHEPAVFTNGALGIYDLKFLRELWPDLTDTAKLAGMVTAFDYFIGRELFRRYKEKMFDKVVHLDCSYSGYGDTFTTYEQRQQWLLSGAIVAVHQIKTAWPGPMEPVHGNLTAPETITSPIEPKLIVASDEPKAPTPDAGAVTSESSALFERGGREILPDSDTKKRSRPRPFKFRVDILIVTHAKDAKWLAVALKSIGKFCRGFGDIVVVSPKSDMAQIHPVLEPLMTDPQFPFDIRSVVFDQAEGKGHLHHMVQKCMADIHCPDADLVLHTDSDCVFFKPTTPQDYFHAGKPVLLMTPYEHIKETHKGHYQWKAVTEQAFKEPVHYSTMERHPAVHWRELYPALRAFINLKQGLTFEQYVLAVAPTFPYGFCEFTALGAFALRSKEFVDKYHFLNTTRQERPDDHLIQFWSHSGLDEPQKAPDHLPAKYQPDAEGNVVPRAIINDILEVK